MRRRGTALREFNICVLDRPRHDLRSVFDCSKLTTEEGWRPRETFETGLRKPVRGRPDNRPRWETMRARTDHGQRLGLTR